MRNNILDPFPKSTSGKPNEMLDLVLAWVATAAAFAIAMRNGNIMRPGFWQIFLISIVTCGLGFVIHELAHRVVARRFGAEAHFVANRPWLALSVIFAFTGFFFAAPGAVWYRGSLSDRQGGLIAVAGPVSNLILAVVFLAVQFSGNVIRGSFGQILVQVGSIGYNINAWLGLFNMIPGGPFDGAKVIAWNNIVWGVVSLIGVVMVFVLPNALHI